MSIFKKNPIPREQAAILAGNSKMIYRFRTNPNSGRIATKIRVFPKSASEANYPQRVKRNGA